jgi:peptidoglycan/xylan/chitin deacetylase (PgdA/CDA1 family)
MRLPGSGRIRRLAQRVRGRFAVRGLILMYHRIAELNSDPWGLSVSPAHFAEHLKVLRSSRSVIALPDLVETLRRGYHPRQHPRQPVVVTFDDGYADNVDTAKPLLERYEIPATVFLVTGAIGSDREFWWDELDRVLLEPRELPQVLELRLADCSHRWELGADAAYDSRACWKNRLWRTWEAPPTARHTLYYELWQRLYPLPDREKRALLDELLAWAGLDSLPRPSHRLVSLDQLKQLGECALIGIGAHTVTHAALPELRPESQREEIQESRSFLERALSRPVSCFAYPHGGHDSSTVSLVREAGFTAACTTVPGAVSRQSGCLALPRYQVLDWNGEEFRSRLEAWREAGTFQS